MLSLQDLRNAHDRIRPFIHRTPCLTCHTLDQMAGATLVFKCENFQKIGAFKARGGMNAALQLADNERKNGLATHSSGNHGQAVAFAARQLGMPAYVVMPRTAPQVKKDAVRGYGATVIECEPNIIAREAGVAAIITQTGAALIHPFDDDRVIAGQSTAAIELIEDNPTGQPFDVIMAPVGGGGLISGTALATHFLAPATRVVGAEPEGAADAILSFKSGHVEKAPYISTIADGLMAPLSERTLGYIRQYVSDIRLVNDVEIRAAQRLVWERMKIIIEPSCAVPLAVVLRYKDEFAGQTIGIILTGGNVDLGNGFTI
ncbi:threonine/serine dehydratase [Fibrella sp. HMF5335]|uniref:Threonine/serine dehydratase n=1 Tax=Fibrella rubiginis TaxID=2817060 RepID=A0A939GJ83_9BACT|nr:threonine/serine dehydratase [Fibrella rubiginis]MBO0938450.1 threonine/serine dehydratase [Fibrella rubiginis]